MADKNFGVKQVNFVGSSGAPKIESSGSGNLNIDAATVAISTNLTVGSDLEVDGDFTVNNTGYGFTVTTQTGFAVTTDGTGLGLGYDLMKVSGEHNETYQSMLNIDNFGPGASLLVPSGSNSQPLLYVRGTGRGQESGYRYINGFDAYRPTQVGTAVISSAISPLATITTQDGVYQYYRSNIAFFDMDRDGVVSPGDALIATRGAFGSAYNSSALTNGIVMGNGTYTNSDYAEIYDRIQVMKNAPYDINVNVGVNTNILTNVGTGITQIIEGNDYPVGITTFIPADTTVTGVNTVTGEVTISKTTTNTVSLTGVAVTFGMGSHGYGMWDIDGSGAPATALGDLLMVVRMTGGYDQGDYHDPTDGGEPTNDYLNPVDYGPARYGAQYPRIGIGTVPVKVLDVVGDTRIGSGELDVNSKLIVPSSGVTTITGDVSIGSTTNEVDITGADNSKLYFEGGWVTLNGAGIVTSIDGILNGILRIYNSDDPSEPSTLKVISEGSKFTSVTRQTSPQVGTGITGSLTFEEPSRDTDAEVYDYCWDNYSKFDVDGDGVVSSNDILYLNRYAIGLETVTTSITPPSTATRTTNQKLKEWMSRHESRTGIGSLSNGSKTITGISTSGLEIHIDQYVSGDDIQSGTVITGIGQSTIFISKSATSTGTTSITFGDGTYNVVNTSTGTMGLYDDLIAITRVFYSDIRNPMEVDYPPVFTSSQYKVGIGSDNPKQILDVGGNAEISGILTANSLRGGSLDLSDTTFRRVAGIITDPAGDADPSDAFGNDLNVSADGNIICISARNYDWPSYNLGGAVYVYDRSGNTYSQVGILSAGDDTQAIAFFGQKVAMSRDGSTIVISAPYYDDVSAGVGTCGRAYVFERSGSTFTRTGILSASDQSDSITLGQSLAISGDGNYIAIGAPRVSSTTGNNQVYIYKNSGGTFSEIGIITAGDYETGSSTQKFGPYNGLAFTPDASTLVITNEHAISSTVGQVHVFDRSGDTFARVGVITGPSRGEFGSSSSYDIFGASVAVTSDGKTIIVGATWEDVGEDESGNVFVYDRLSDNTFSRVGILSSANSQTLGYFGDKVSTNDSGSLIAVGARSENVSGISSAGHVYLFERRENTFTRIADLTETDPSTYHRFGTDVKISPDSSTLVISRGYSSSGPQTFNGEVSVYDANSISNTFTTETGKLSVGEPNPQKQFNVHGDSAFEGKIETSKGVVGSIRQVVGYSTDAVFDVALTGGEHNTIDEMGVEINLSSASNKVLVSYTLTGEFSVVGDTYNSAISFARVSSNYASGIVTVAPGNVEAGFSTDPGSRNRGITTPVTNYQASNASSTAERLSLINFLDSPNTTGIVTYYPTIYPSSTGTWNFNNTVTDSNSSSYERFISYITLQEIVG